MGQKERKTGRSDQHLTNKQQKKGERMKARIVRHLGGKKRLGNMGRATDIIFPTPAGPASGERYNKKGGKDVPGTSPNGLQEKVTEGKVLGDSL